MHKPSAKVAKIAVVALAIPLFGGFATYAAAQVSTKPAPQVVIPGGPGADDKGGATKTTVADDPATHDANDDKGGNQHTADDNGGVTGTTGSDDPANHDANDDKGGLTNSSVSDDAANHDAKDDKGGVTQTTVSDDPANHDAADDKGHDAVTPARPATTPVSTPASTPVTVDDRGGKHGSGGHGADG